MKHLIIKASGKVQGVMFRYFAKQEADKLNLVGFTRNEPNGSVYIEVQGEKENLDKFIDWCKKGPPFAQVENIILEEKPLERFTNFTTY